MKRLLLFSMLVALMSMMGISPVLADSGDSADDPLTLGSGTCSFTWAGSNVWFKAVVPAGRTLVTTSSEGTIQADIYDCYDDVASESYVTKTFSSTTPLKYENAENEDATIYVKVKNVLNATDVNFSTWFDYVVAPVNTTWQTATEVGEGTLNLDVLDKDHNAPLWYKVVVPANTKVTLQKNYPHTCLVYAGDDNAESGTNVNGLFMYGNTKATYTNSASSELNLYIQVFSTSGIAPYTITISFEAATPEAGSAWNYPLSMVEGDNNIKTIGDGAAPVWYACKVAARTKVTFTNNYWPITVSFYEGDDAAKADAEPAGSNFDAGATQTFENTSNAEETIYMKVVYSMGFAAYANVGVAFEALPASEGTADKAVGEYTGTYEFVSASAGYPSGKTGSQDGLTLTVTKNSDNTVDITTPDATLGELAFASYTIYNVAVDDEGNISGGSIKDGESYESFSAWGSAYTFSVTGKLDAASKAADVTINIHASVMPGAVADMVMTFKSAPAAAPADVVAGEYTGTYTLESATGGAPDGITGSLEDAKMTVAKNTDNTVDITLPECNLGIPFASYTIKNVAVDAEGNLSGGDMGDEPYVVVGTGWGSATAFSVNGKLDGTNADIEIIIAASTVAGGSIMEMTFKTATVESTADNVVGDYTGIYALVSADGGTFNGRTGDSGNNMTMTVTKNTENTIDIQTPQVSTLSGVGPFYSYTIKGVVVDAEGNISGGSLGEGVEYVTLGPWGSVMDVTVTGTLDGTNADVTFNMNVSTVGGSSTMIMTFKSGTATSINTVATYEDGAIYNLQGVRVNDSYKGIVIKNGKKYLNK